MENNYNKLIDAICELVNLAYDATTSKEEFERLDNAGAEVIDCLEKLQQFEAIGTVEEFKVLKEKNVAKKPIEKVLPYSEEFGFNSEWKCPTCGAYVCYFTEGMNEPEQMEYCNECGQHIAKDWTET